MHICVLDAQWGQTTTKMSEFGAENGLLQGHARRCVAPALKPPHSLKALNKALF